MHLRQKKNNAETHIHPRRVKYTEGVASNLCVVTERRKAQHVFDPSCMNMNDMKRFSRILLPLSPSFYNR